MGLSTPPERRRNSSVSFSGVWPMALPLLVLALIFGVYFFVQSRMSFDYPSLYPRDGVLDLREVSFDNTVYDIVNTWDYYPGALYGPGDFADPGAAPQKNNKAPLDHEKGTYRLIILTQPHSWLSLAHFSIDYSTRIFVNGMEVRNIGFVSEDPLEVEHKSRFLTLPLYGGEEGRIELIYQYANYMHKDGGFLQKTHLSTPEVIDEFVRGITLYSLFTSCGLLFLAFYFLLFAAWQRQREFAALALCCAIIAFRNQFFLTEHLLPPSYDFILEYRFFILIVSWIPITVLLLLGAFYPAVGRKYYILPLTGAAALITAAHFILPSRELVGLCHISYYLCFVFLVWGLILLIKSFLRAKKPTALDLLRLGAILILIIMLTREGLSSGSNYYAAHYGISPTGMLICILILAMTTNIALQRQAAQLLEEQRKNEMLEQVNTMNKDFLQTVAHELKTPLTVISGYAQLIRLQMENKLFSENMPERLGTIRSEADRLGEIVTTLMDYTYGHVRDAKFAAVDLEELLRSTAAIMNPVCAKRGNTLRVENSCTRPVHGNFELLLQVLINLIVNASRHTDKGSITLSVSETPEAAAFVVEDTGSGIPEEAAAHIFEKGFSTSDSNGLGLSICMETVMIHGGELTLLHTGKEGTAFRFTIPWEKTR